MKKTISILLIFLLVTLSITQVKAVIILPEETISNSGQRNIEGILYDNQELPIVYCYLRHNKIKYPLYNLNQEGTYPLDPSFAFTGYVKTIIKDNNLRNALLLGYSASNEKSMTTNEANIAYALTQIAIWDNTFHYDITKFSVEDETKYPNFLNKLSTFLEEVRNCTNKKENVSLTIDSISNHWETQDEKVQYKIYKVISNMQAYGKYKVSIEYLPNYKYLEYANLVKILNEENEETSNFLPEEKFKISMPKDLEVEFTIKVEGEFLTNPVAMSDPLNSKSQKYILLIENENVKTNLMESHSKVIEKEQEEIPKEPAEELVDKEQVVTIQKIETPKKDVPKLPNTGF